MSTVIRFSGDSGDGMQMVGNLFSESAAFAGYGVFTFPDYPAEVRAPQGTVAGVSGFQVHFGSQAITHQGDKCDILVAMNPAALVAHRKYATATATIILDSDGFTKDAVAKVGYDIETISEQLNLGECNIVEAPITQMTLDAVVESGLDRKAALKCRNMLVLGITLGMYDISADYAKKFVEKKFGKKNPLVSQANIAAIEAGENYARNSHLVGENHERKGEGALAKGVYRSINGNQAVAWGFIAAAERSGRPLFCGSYPITPATGILEELAKHKALGVKTVQAEDEIAGICTAIGASFGGALAVTTTSGPGLALKSEALGLAVMAQMPLVVVDVQRGGPSTGLPTKSEQADLLQAMYGRNGDSPLVVLSAHSPADCFDKAYMAAKIALERMMPVVLLTDGNLANGTEPWRVKRVAEMPTITPPIVSREELAAKAECFNERGLFNPYSMNENLARYWAVPGAEGLEHRLGGLEKHPVTGAISYSPEDHAAMGKLRAERVERVADMVAEVEVVGASEGDLLVLSWGSNVGKVSEAVAALHAEGAKVAHATVELVNPLQRGVAEAMARFKRVLVCETNSGQLASYLRSVTRHEDIRAVADMGAQPFVVDALKAEISSNLNLK
ncbi:MAG: 2-oxoacid:acceptor oxidoreductase subunit alpha [Rikenellaceae bacterium]|nr:2-oxoacid:acceptor oxidoreductase subunit alpha [Rikenellaceae bacterium]